MNPRTENPKDIECQSLTEIDKQSVATSVAKLLNEYPDLLEVIQVWPHLDRKIRRALLAMIREMKD